MSDEIEKAQTQSVLTVEEKVKSALRVIAERLSECDLSTNNITQTFNALKDWRTNFEALENYARKRLTTLAQEKGTVISEAGSKRAIIDGWVFEIRPTGAKWNTAHVTALLKGKGLDVAKWMQPTVKYDVDEARLIAAVELGHITQAEVDACRNDRRFALQPPHLLANEED